MTAKSDLIGKTPMQKYDNTNRGALFSDRENKTRDDDRDYAGTINVGGREYWLSGWLKTSKKGTKFLSLRVKEKSQDAAPKAKIDDEVAF